MRRRRVCVITTGGSLDKIYPEGKNVRGFAFPVKSTVTSILRRGRAGKGIPLIKSPFFEDGLDLTNDNREIVLAELRAREMARIGGVVITHGTDTMVETASFIAKRIGDDDAMLVLEEKKALRRKAIVFTGALQPACMRETDADFNVGFALGIARIAPAGIYIAIQGQVFEWHNCQKKDDGTFARIHT